MTKWAKIYGAVANEHSFVIGFNEEFLYFVNVGISSLLIYEISAQNGQLTQVLTNPNFNLIDKSIRISPLIHSSGLLFMAYISLQNRPGL